MRLFKVIVNESTITEKHLMVYIREVQEEDERYEIKHLGWMKIEKKITHGMTRIGRCEAVEKLLRTGLLDMKVNQWV